MNTINICIACDDNYAKYAGVTIASILHNANEEDELIFYILDGNISTQNKDKIKELRTIKNCEINFIHIDETLFDDYKKIKTHKYISLATYYRLKLSELLPQIKKIIYLDCDIVVNHSLKDLFNYSDKNFEIAGVQDLDYKLQKNIKTYTNAGMLLINLEEIRINNTEDLFLNYAIENQKNITCGDQEIINSVLNGKIKLLDEKWNVQVANIFCKSSKTKTPYIIHYIGSNKPWMKNSWNMYKTYYFKYLKLTPWYQEEKERYKTLWLENFLGVVRLLAYRTITLPKRILPSIKKYKIKET